MYSQGVKTKVLAEAQRHMRCCIPKEIRDHVRIAGDWGEDIWRMFLKKNMLSLPTKIKSWGHVVSRTRDISAIHQKALYMSLGRKNTVV